MIVINDVKEKNSAGEIDIVLDFLTSENYDEVLTEIGRSPDYKTQLRGTKIGAQTYRNPPLIENRSVVYEFADSYKVKNIIDEGVANVSISSAAAVSDNTKAIGHSYAARENRRTDVLDLNMYNYNHLIERVEGTVVDIYGNILDLNRNKIVMPTEFIDAQGSTSDKLRRQLAFLRRSIKYHFEINSRKELVADTQDKQPKLPILPDVGDYNLQSFSRWSVDVDAEGLTKINIPASSETGNVPILSRYVVPSDIVPRDPHKIDVCNAQFGTQAQKIDGYGNLLNVPTSPLATIAKTDGFYSGTAHHDISKVASTVISNPIAITVNNQIADLDAGGKYNPAVNTSANAGGRSISANLDGSLELSVGADTVDRKSLVVDTAGGVIATLGRDRNGRSVIAQMDGYVLVEIGGVGISGDKRFDTGNDYQSGRVEIHINGKSGLPPQKIIIDENGITFDIQGFGIIKTSGNLALSAGGSLLLDAENVYTYGDVDMKTGDITGFEQLLERTGRGLH